MDLKNTQDTFQTILKIFYFFMPKKEVQPDFIELKDREKFDLTKLGKEIYDKDLRIQAKNKFIEECWNKDESEWKVFFGFDKKYFINEIRFNFT